jgi:hypothetical protein
MDIEKVENVQQVDVPVAVDNQGNVEVIGNPTKQWWKSKTIIFNVAFTALTVAANTLPMLQGQFNITPETYALISGIVNIGLRAMTNKGITAA